MAKARQNNTEPARVFRKTPDFLSLRDSGGGGGGGMHPMLHNADDILQHSSSSGSIHENFETISPPVSSNVWRKITSPFRRRKSMLNSRDTSLQGSSPAHINQRGGANISQEGSLKRISSCNPDAVHTFDNTSDRQTIDASSTDQSSRGSERLEAVSSMHMQYREPPKKAIGPANFADNTTDKATMRKLAQLHKTLPRTADIVAQKTEIVISNGNAAAELIDNMMVRIWQSEAVWVDFHISEFVLEQNNPVKDLQKIWLDWIGLLGTPSNAELAKSRIILRGLVGSWDEYRAVLDCSRYTPDNDDVLLSTSWWVAEMATSFSIDDERGRTAQTAIFRMGCRCSDHINSRILFLRSRFLQTALVTLSPLAKGMYINIGQVQVFLVECQLLLSLGISGARMLLLALDKGLRRLFLEVDSYQGELSEPDILGAVTMLTSINTLLSVGRVLNANHKNVKIRILTDSNTAEPTDPTGGPEMLAGVVPNIERMEYPIIREVPGVRQYHVEWEKGGPIFGRTCETLWRLLLSPRFLTNLSQKCKATVEYSAISGLALVGFTELKISDKRRTV
ncbi:hypothetical protein LPJ66_007371 [Kickxella alabastrina]|uniref:Uncharacterized protein n=1 Tax=Kickxella alabastrina TaxID=61397 RepID=A0ACC1IF59_9FUNG|nr:hypothetical protein LPJ66_007371 [Kickxella alabastrina]